MESARHRELIGALAATASEEWGPRALLACLRKLRDGGPTEAALVVVHDAWATPDEFRVIYDSPWGPVSGLSATAGRRSTTWTCTPPKMLPRRKNSARKWPTSTSANRWAGTSTFSRSTPTDWAGGGTSRPGLTSERLINRPCSSGILSPLEEPELARFVRSHGFERTTLPIPGTGRRRSDATGSVCCWGASGSPQVPALQEWSPAVRPWP